MQLKQIPLALALAVAIAALASGCAQESAPAVDSEAPAVADAAHAEADHQQRVGQRRIGARHAELGLYRRQHHRHDVHAAVADGHQGERGEQARPGVA